MDSDAFDRIVASLDTRMIVVTTAAEGERAGCLVGFHTQSSIDPQRYCVWLSKANHTYRLMLRSTHLGVHFLTVDDLPLAERFGTVSGDDIDKFEGLRVGEGEGKVPVLLDCAHRLEVERLSLLDEGGDHVCVITEPVAVHTSGELWPMVFSQVRHLDPGHGAEERPAPPTERAVS